MNYVLSFTAYLDAEHPSPSFAVLNLLNMILLTACFLQIVITQ